MKKFYIAVIALALFLAITAFPTDTSANHAWSKYHWARTTNSFTLKLGDNTTAPWSSMLVTASSDWSQSTVLDTQIVAGGTNRSTCNPTYGRVEVCNDNYGNTGWLGVAQIWLTTGSHIAQGTVKNNDYYFGSSTYQYNNSAEQLHVICQEVGHTFGLDHQSTNGSSLNTCMDYYHNTSASDTLSTHPNAGDYDQLRCIYDPAVKNKTLTSGPHTCRGTGHLDAFSTATGAGASLPALLRGNPNDRSEWGTQVGGNAYFSVFERDLGNGVKLVTHVIWAK